MNGRAPLIGVACDQYQVTAPLGAGAMGEVFRARDIRLGREVAIKFLPKVFASDPDRLRRFDQEAKTLAALNHPNILTIYNAGVHQGTPYLASELLEGRTLREVLGASKSASLPLKKAVDYGLQIARGLAAAHGRGIVHRDLKPENVFVLADGRVKILDFGLAKFDPRGPESETFNLKSQTSESAPTLLTTLPGMVLGTPAYMSPEQVQGEAADHRSDLFAFGCVLFEMLTGAPAFRRGTPAESMLAVLKEEPPGLDGPAGRVPIELTRVVRHCLEKQPDDRFQSAKDLAFAMESALVEAEPDGKLTTPISRGIHGRYRVWAGVGLGVLAFGLGALAHRLWPKSQSPAVPSIRSLTYSGHDYSPSASADGKRICFSSDRDGTKRIWVKDVVSGWETPLTEGPDDLPRFSRDDSTILFTRLAGSRRALFRVPSMGGQPFRIVDDALSGDWSPNGRQIAFVRWGEDHSSSVCTVGVDGSGEALLHRFTGPGCSLPRWSPDGQSVAVTVNESGRPQSLVVIRVTARQVQTLTPPNRYNLVSGMTWDADSRSLLYMQAESAAADSSGSTAQVFRQRLGSGELQRLLWSPAMCAVLDLHPSGNLLMDARSSRENLREFAITSGGPPARALTLGSSTDRQPAYSPDGNEIVFSSNLSGRRTARGSSTETSNRITSLSPKTGG